jgi:DNA replication protein DnaC
MDSLKHKLKLLKLDSMSAQLDRVIQQSANNVSIPECLELLADLEIEGRAQRAIERRFRSSRLYAKPTVDQFNFNHHKSRAQIKGKILSMLDLNFIGEGANIILIGNPGTGKTFLSQIIGWRACQHNHRVLFTTAMDMLNQLLASSADHSVARKLKLYTDPTMLICDELGYLSLDQQTSNLFYQVISSRYAAHRSTVITTNTPFSEWGNILFNTTIASAIADRLVENSQVFVLGGDSVRKAKRGRAADGNPDDDSAGSASSAAL